MYGGDDLLRRRSATDREMEEENGKDLGRSKGRSKGENISEKKRQPLLWGSIFTSCNFASAGKEENNL